MQMNENLLVIKYREILKYNAIAPEKINFLVKEYIDYIEGIKIDNLSNELIEFLSFIQEKELKEQQSKKRRI